MSNLDIEHDNLTPEADWRRSGPFIHLLNRFASLSIWEIPLVAIAAVLLLLIPMYMVMTVPLSLGWQTMFGIVSFIICLWLRRYEGHLISIAIMTISLLSSLRYFYWRLTETMPYGVEESSFVDNFLATGLILAELYALLVLVFGFFQVIWPLHRKPTRLPDDTEEWPTVDVYIPTYNEPLSVVRPTVLAAQDLDWPQDKLNIYVLDDGCRDEFGAFCESVGVTHLPRKESTHAKAGNINKALTKTDGDLVCIFDCDHIPTRSFLQLSVGWFVQDPKMALVQLPHHFFSPDPFERNLGTFKEVPNEGELFYGLLQDGNDFWNATFFCGSCAVLRRTALEEVEGVAVETVTEDAHTALKMHRRGWRSAYINVAQAAGLATESLSAHVGQRIRWARGMAQIFRTDNPFLGRGLSIGQRICYSNAMLHFFYGLPRLVFLTAPLSFLFFEAHIITASALMITAYALPHLVMANLTNSRLQGPFRHSFWAEVYESVLAYYILVPTFVAIINPKAGAFNVTAKGGKVENTYFDKVIAKPYLILFFLNLAGIIVGIFRALIWNVHEVDTVLLNMFWSLYNMTLVGASMSVAWEARQIRDTIRVDTKLSARVRLADGTEIEGHTVDLSEGGAAVLLDASAKAEVGSETQVKLIVGGRGVWLPTIVTRSADKMFCVKFDELSTEEERHLIYCIFGRADAWVAWANTRDVDHPGRAFLEVLSYGYYGVYRILGMYLMNMKERVASSIGRKRNVAAAASIALLAVGAATLMMPSLGHAQLDAEPEDAVEDALLKRGGTTVLSLEDLAGYQQAIRLRGVQGEVTVPVSVRDDQVITGAEMTLNFAHSPSLLMDLSHINVFLNQELVTTIPLSETTAAGSSRTFNLDPRLFTRYNDLLLQFIGHYTLECEDPAHTSLWASISKTSSLTIDTQPLALADDLNLLPAPFFERGDQRRLVLPFVFAGEPDVDELKAAGIVASWFGMLADYRGAKFPVFINRLPPTGHAVVFSTRGDSLPGVRMPPSGSMRVSMTTRPGTTDKLLVVSAPDSVSLVDAARALAIGPEAESGESTAIVSFTAPKARKAYDAPRWVSTDHPVEFSDLVPNSNTLEVRGLYPDLIRVGFHVPPDLFGWRSKGVPADLKYRYTPTIGNKSTLNVNINNEFVEAIPLATASGDDGSNDRIQIPFINSFQSTNERTVRIPLEKITGDNQLQLHYYFERKKEGACRDVVIDNLRGAVDGDSTLDFTDFSHYTALPELSLFANGSFPFSKFADYSQTAVVLPARLSESEITAYLTVMGQFGNSVGYPATRVKLVSGSSPGDLSGMNVLVLGTTGNQPLLDSPRWRDEMPLSVNGGETTLRTVGPIERVLSRWRGRDFEAAKEHAGKVVVQAGEALGAIMSFESPDANDKVAVVMTAGSEERLVEVTDLLLDPGDRQFIRGDLVLLNGQEINHYRLGSQFKAGKLPFLTWMKYKLSKQPFWMAVGLLLIALLIAVILYTLLRRMALARHRGER